MREIKFRSWDVKNKQMIGPYEIGSLHAEKYGFNYKDKKHGIYLMQYTGLKDKNGKEIYEGDILKSYKGIVEVYWEIEEAMFRINPNLTWFDRVAHDKHTEIIGNIYENPELLEEKE